MAKIACLGVGKMGSGVAGNLLTKGHHVSLWNRSPAACEPLAAMGAVPCPSPAGAAAGADFVISIVSDDTASDRVWLAEDGALAAMKPGAVAIECSTISHGQALKLEAATKACNLRYIDAPMNGGPPLAAAGEMILLVGAAPDDFAVAEPVLTEMSGRILQFGEVGAGTAFKLINNLLGAVHISALAEAVALAGKIGLDNETLVEAIETGPCASPHVKRLARAMIEDRGADQQNLSIGLREKDSRYCLSMAKAFGASLPVGQTAYDWYQTASKTQADQDDGFIIQTIRAD